jgi:hypothetical protein
MFRQVRAIPIPIMTIGMRLPPNRIDAKRMAASKSVLSEVEGPEALGMDANARLRLNTFKIHFAYTGKIIKISLCQITDESPGDEPNFKEKAWKPENAKNADRSFKSG